MNEPIPSDALSSLKAKLTAANPEHSVLLQNALALALIECAEIVRTDYLLLSADEQMRAIRVLKDLGL